MFTKKPAPPPPAPVKPQAAAQPSTPAPAARPSGWAAQILTADYLASGYLQPVDMPLVGFLNVSTQATVALANVQLQAVGAQATVANPNPAEATFPKSSIIAFVPRDEPGLKAAALQMPNRPERAVLYAGPYVIRAALMLVGDMPLRNFFGTGSGAYVAVTDAEITCQIPGAKFQPLTAKIMVVNKALVQLYHPA
jgi:hypothetical protein